MSKGAKYVTSGSNIQELISAVQQSAKIQEEMRLDSVSTEFILKNIAANMNDAAEGIIAIKDHMITNGLKSLETQREANAYNDRILEALQGIEKKKDKPTPEAKGDFSWLGLAGTLIAGLVSGGISFITNYVKGFVNLWTMVGKKAMSIVENLLKWIDVKSGGIITRVAEFFKGIGEFFARMWTKVVEGFNIAKAFISESLTKVWTVIDDFFKNGFGQKIKAFFDGFTDVMKKAFSLEDIGKDFAALWGNIKGIFGMMFGPESAIGKLFSGGGGMIDDVLKAIKGAFSFFEPLVSFFKNLGKILGKLAVPLQVIMSVFDTVSGALDGWNKTEGSFMDKLFGAIKGGITGLLNGLIGGLLDLLKDGTSWLLNLLGFENASKFLDSFSFEKIIEQGVSGFFDFVRGMIDYVKELFVSGVQLAKDLGGKILAIGDMAMDFLKSILRGILPNPQNGMAQSLAAKAIPDAVYEFAGLDKKTGEQLASQTAENTQAKTEQQSLAANPQPVIVSGGGNSSSSKSVEKTAVVSARSTKFDNEDMWARGATIM